MFCLSDCVGDSVSIAIPQPTEGQHMEIKLKPRLSSIRDRLGTATVKGQALDLCQELFVAGGARSDEEDAVLQNLRTLLE
jgi:hypothetical protein